MLIRILWGTIEGHAVIAETGSFLTVVRYYFSSFLPLLKIWVGNFQWKLKLSPEIQLPAM